MLYCSNDCEYLDKIKEEDKKMSLQVEKLEHNMAKLTIEVSAEEVEKALQAAYIKERKKISVPGFRKGKVPRQMIEKMYGPEVFYDEAANHMISEAYGKAYDECELELVSQPKIDIVQLEKGKPFIFTAEVAVKPEVTLGEYKGLKVDKVSTRVTQKEVDEEIEKERERNARTIEVTDRAVQDKDQVLLDFEGFVDGEAFEGGKGEKYPLTIGSGAFIPGFEEQLIGAEIGKEMEVNVTFPEEYQAKELAGKAAVFKCTVHEIKVRELPELDDEFASDVSECETLDAYKAEVKKKIKERKEREGKEKKENQAVDAAIENAQMDIPAAMIDLQTKQMADDFARRIMQQGLTVEQYFQFTGMTEEKMMEELRPQAEKRIKTRLVLEAVVAAENIEVSEERLEEELKKMAESYQMEVEKLKEFMGENEKKQMKEDIAVQEAVTLIAEAAVEG
jgi:trigger factor